MLFMDDGPLGGNCVFLERSQLSYYKTILDAGAKPVAVVTLPDTLVPGNDARIFCKNAIEEIRLVTHGEIPVCIAIHGGDFYYQPYGETPFGLGVAHFHELSCYCADHGADAIMVHRARSMLQARAGVLGARASGLPVLVSMELIGEGELLGETDLLAAFAVLGLLGISAFGCASSVAGIQLEALETIAAHHHLPLFSITQNLTGTHSAAECSSLFVARATKLASLGITTMGIWDAGEQQLAEAVAAMSAAACPPADQRGSLTAADMWAANETQVYYLDENVEFSQPVDCRPDMTDDVLEAEKQVCDLLYINVESPDDAYSISINNGNIDQMPVCFLCHDEASLEAALFYYNGRAAVDSRSLIPPEALERLAQQYGALII